MPVQQRPDGDSIYAQLLHEVQRGVMPESGFLREIDLAERFGVSRTPVREVLSRLVHDRLLERTPKGLRIRTVTPEEVIQVYDARILLEAEAAAQAARSRHVTDLVALQGLLERDRALIDPDDETRTDTNLEFHGTIWSAAHNAVLDDLLGRLSIHMIHTPVSTLSLGNRWRESLDEHDRILRAIEDRDEERARSLMAAHMQLARDLRLKLFGRSAAA